MAYSKEQKAAIYGKVCTAIAGGQSLRKICEAKDMPSIDTVRVWLIEDAEFSAQYARAREEQADYYADEIVTIADTEEDPNRARVRIDARKWTAGKLKPKVYGDKVDLSGALRVTLTHEEALEQLE